MFTLSYNTPSSFPRFRRRGGSSSRKVSVIARLNRLDAPLASPGSAFLRLTTTWELTLGDGGRSTLEIT